jgi:hypothetical protein
MIEEIDELLDQANARVTVMKITSDLHPAPPNRNIGLGPEHDWSSHAADSFGYLAIAYEEPPAAKSEKRGRQGERPPRGTFWSA